MQRPSIDSNVIIPILLGFFSVGGLCIVLLFGRLNNSRTSIQTNDTSTPFEYVYLGTEPGIFEPTLEETEPPAATEAPFEDDTPRPPLSTQVVVTSLSTNTPASFFSTNTPLRTPTRVYTSTPGVSIYDDADFRLVYSGSWTAQENVPGTYQNTLHISSSAGNSVVFNFLGQQVQVTYQAGPSLGTLTITLDNLGVTLDQSNTVTEVKTWVSGVLVQGTHTVVITHTSGGSVNIDSITIPDVRTATPTSNP